MRDEEIVQLYFERSEDAIDETAIKYGNLCKSVAKNVLKDLSDVEECVNDTYLGAWNTIPPTKPQILSAYLCKLTRNLALKRYEYMSAQKRNPEVQCSFTELEECITDKASEGLRYTDETLKEIINRFLQTEKQETRMIFIRRYWYCDSVKDICKRFHISKSKAETILCRTRKKLKLQLEEEGYDI